MPADALFPMHVVGAVSEIESCTTAGRRGFMEDSKTQSAVRRQLEIIGEAVKNISKKLTESEPGVP